MTRMREYLTYHHESAAMGDIDPSHKMLLYVCDRFELNIEQRFWLAFIYALTYNGASTFYVYNEFPDFCRVDQGRMRRWWESRGREEVMCQTDRRWVRSLNLFAPAVESYTKLVGSGPDSQQQHFHRLTLGCRTPEERYTRIYNSAKGLTSFGQFALFLYLEALHTITPLDLCPTDLDLRQAHSCRSGLLYASGLDSLITEGDGPLTPQQWEEAEMDRRWLQVRDQLCGEGANVWNIETTLCAYKKYHRGKRYLGYYLDRQALEIAKMEEKVQNGVCWGVLWDYRREHIQHSADLAELSVRVHKGLPEAWKRARRAFTETMLGGAQ